MLRKIIRIDEEKCDGCGVCVPACPEGALEIVEGKAKLAAEIYCDGLGACLGECPRGAITVEEREAEAFDEKAAQALLADRMEKEEKKEERAPAPFPATGGCPGAAPRSFGPTRRATTEPSAGPSQESALRQWPVQLMLVPPFAPYLQGADLLICADCVPFAVPDFHSRFLEGRAVLVGCPKLDDLRFYREKLAGIFEIAKPKSITVLRMEVPCCGGIAAAAVEARNQAAPGLSVEVYTVGIEGGVEKEHLPARAPARA